ncbi:MAG: PIN domain-containing protein [archaeon]
MRYFFDSYAIIEMINQNPNYLNFVNEQIATNALNLGEVYFYFLRRHGRQTAEYWVNSLSFELIDFDRNLALEAAAFRFEHKKKQFSYPDCIGYLSALKNGLVFLTGDREFEGMPNVLFVK